MAGDSTIYATSRPDVPTTLSQATPGDGRSLLEHSGWLDHLKHAANSAAHGASKLVHEGVQEGREVAKKPAVAGVLHDLEITGKDLAKQQVDEVNGAIAAGKRGDVDGVIKHAAPIVEEVALGPHGVAAKVIKDEAAHVIKQHAEEAAREQLHGQIKKHNGSTDNNTNGPNETSWTDQPTTTSRGSNKF